MRNFIANMKANPWLYKRLIVVALVLAATGGGFWFGQKRANDKHDAQKATEEEQGRTVAYLYGNVPVSREEFAEYLITRFGNERLDFMLNRKIVEIECAKLDVTATDEEVDYRFRQELAAFGGTSGMDEKTFQESILKRFGKSMFEWKEDVIRPKIMLEKLARKTVKVTEDDLVKGFEARYGPKVECRMIVMDGRDSSVCQKVWENARKGRSEFLEEARKQYIPQLAKEEGKVPPIHKHLGEPIFEDAAFRLQPGEVSALLRMPDQSYVILMCEKHLQKDVSVRYEDVKQQILRELIDIRTAAKAPEVFSEMRLRARPQPCLVVRSTSSTPVVPASFLKEMRSPTQVPEFRPGDLPPAIAKKASPLPETGPLPPPDVKRPTEKK